MLRLILTDHPSLVTGPVITIGDERLATECDVSSHSDLGPFTNH